MMIILVENKNYVLRFDYLKNELAQAHNLIGLVLWHQSQYKEALPHHAISLSLFQETGNQKGLADTYAKTGNVFYDLSDFPKSFDPPDSLSQTKFPELLCFEIKAAVFPLG